MKAKRFNWRSQLCIMHYALCIIMLSTLTMSCSDDDDKKSEEQREVNADPLDTDEAQTAWRWLSALTNAETLTNDWASKTYEPVIGVPSENNANTRIVIVGDLDAAQTSFASMAGVDANSLGTELVVSQPGVGSLAWTPSKAGAQNLAEVRVDTKLIPHLQKIVYCTEEQVGNNGLFSTNVKGTAYYRLGDVVMDKDGYYWVCVRPSFEQMDKGDSHWINIFNAAKTGYNGKTNQKVPMPDDNIYDKYDNKDKYDRRTILLPTKLKYSREHMNNLSNLVFALLDPNDYASKVGTDTINLKKNGLCGFDYKYHGKLFLKKVASYWEEKTPNGYSVWEVLFNRTYSGLQNKKGIDGLLRISYFYQGYQWRIGRTGSLWLFQTERQNGFQKKASGSEMGDKVEYAFADDGFDIRRFCADPAAEDSNVDKDVGAQFEDIGRYYYVVRYKTGEDLMVNGKYSPYEKLNGCTDIYRFNEKTHKDAHSYLETEWNLEHP